jgi:hypothetical protein
MDTDLFFERSASVREKHLSDLRPEPYPHDASLYSACWSILVLFASAYDGEGARKYFIHSFLEKEHSATEFRFCGVFGFGGKFWRNAGRLYVSYYPEDHTKSLDAVESEINEVLARVTPVEGVWGPP